MVNYDQIVFEADERRSNYLANAEARRLEDACADSRPTLVQRTRGWIGAQLVQWGKALQGKRAASSSPTPVTPQLVRY